MNELEKEINLGAESCEKENAQYCHDEQSEAIAHDCFKEGCQFIIEKNLDEQFADFLHLLGAVPSNEKGKWDIVDKEFNILTKTTKELKQYWLENVYGK